MPYNENDYDYTNKPGFRTNIARINAKYIIFASAAYVADQNSSEFINPNMRGGIFTINCTVDPALASVVFTIQGKDELSGEWDNILVSAAVASVSTVRLRVYPGLTAATNLVVSDVLPRIFRVNANHADGDSITYSVGFQGIV